MTRPERIGLAKSLYEAADLRYREAKTRWDEAIATTEAAVAAVTAPEDRAEELAMAAGWTESTPVEVEPSGAHWWDPPPPSADQERRAIYGERMAADAAERARLEAAYTLEDLKVAQAEVEERHAFIELLAATLDEVSADLTLATLQLKAVHEQEAWMRREAARALSVVQPSERRELLADHGLAEALLDEV